MLTTSCEDMLTPDMDRYAKEDKFGQDSIYSALGILRSIQRVAERTVILDASRSDLVTGGTYTTDSINDLMEFNNPQDGSSALCNVADFYHVVNSCNFYLANVDTTVTQNGIKIMQREWAQVQAMRAWAYIQLVRFYGEVPFVTTPVGSTNEAEAAAKSAPKANASNLASMLVEKGLARAYELQRTFGMPDYETFNNGYETFNSKKNFFPVELVLADAYLMGDDYQNAANYYFENFMYNNATTPNFNNNRYHADSEEDFKTGDLLINSGSCISPFSSSNSSTDNITFATSAANSSYGQVLNQIQNIYGFKTTVSGSTQVTPNEQYLQIVPSAQYVSLNRAQRFNRYELDGDVHKMQEAKGGDGRLLAFAPECEFRNGSKTRLIDKFAPTPRTNISENEHNRFSMFSMNYNIPLYRMPVVLLRYAEAVNRLGFPELAFGILKDGIIAQNLPTYGTADIVKEDSRKIKVYDAERDTTVTDTVMGVVIGKIDSEGKVVYTTDSTSVVYGNDEIGYRYVGNFIPNEHHDSIPGLDLTQIPEDVQATWLDVDYLVAPKAYSGGMYYLTMEEAKAMTEYPFLNFSDSKWSIPEAADGLHNYGVHARGAGDCAGIYDTVYTYARQVAEKVAEDYARKNSLSYAEQEAYAQTLYSGDTLLVTDKATIQDAVENLIVDELALETAFESNRFGDLVRIAGHKTKAGVNGTDWLAWKIARRNKNYTDPAAEVDAALKAKLLNKSNWYLALPE